MKAQPVKVRRLGIVIAVAAALLTSACAAGQHAQTSDQKPTLDGTNADVGPIGLRGLAIVAPSQQTYYPAGSDVQVRLVLVNSSNKVEHLTSISTPAAADWGSYAGTPATAAASGTTSSGATETPNAPVAIPAGGRTSWGVPETPDSTLLLLKTAKAVYPGSTVPVTFTFADAGSVTVQVPVSLTTKANSSVIPEPPATTGIGS